jgi:hypothetical protein
LALEGLEGAPANELEDSLRDSRAKIKERVTDAPIIMRGVIGLKINLCAPFWHDLLQSLLSAKNALRRRTYEKIFGERTARHLTRRSVGRILGASVT